MGEKIENGTIHVGEIIGKTLDGKYIYKFTELGMAENVKIIEPQYKDGDFVVNMNGSVLIFKKKVEDRIYDHALFNNVTGLSIAQLVPSYSPIRRRATEEEKQTRLDALAKEGKRWNEEKKCIEDIPNRKFKKGDKVRIKAGISSKTHYNIDPGFVDEMDDLIGKTMTVDRYTHGDNYVKCEGIDYSFHEDWIEPYEELKKGDLAIFWDDSKEYAIIKFYDRSNESEKYIMHKDNVGFDWKNAIKLESKEQYERLIRGEI